MEQSSKEIAQETSSRKQRNYREAARGGEGLQDPLLPPTSSPSNPAPRPGSALQYTKAQPQESILRQRGPRLLDRDSTFHQSRGRWKVQHVARSQAHVYFDTAQDGGLNSRSPTTPRRLGRIRQIWNDWFHTLAYQKTHYLILYLFMTYLTIVFLFAGLYLAVSTIGSKNMADPNNGSIHTELFCDMDIHDPMEALYFALSTQATIGYGVSDYYFGGCWTPFVLVLIQVWCSLLFDAIAIGLLFQRISRGHKRSKTILFSKCVVIRCVQGVPHLYFRLTELRNRHPLLQTRVQAYCIQHVRHQATTNHRHADEDDADDQLTTTHFVTKPVPLLQSNVLMSLPQVIVHRMDTTSNSTTTTGDRTRSPLLPPPQWYDAEGTLHKCPSPIDSSDETTSSTQQLLQDTQRYWNDRQMELIVILEGIDELTGSLTQRRHSYTLDDTVWNAQLCPCLKPSSEAPHTNRHHTTATCIVDLAQFHETIPAPDDADECPYL